MMKIKMGVFGWFPSLFFAIMTEGFSVQGPAMPLVVQLGASVTLPCSVDTRLPLHELEVQWMREDSGSLVHLFQDGESRPESQSPAYSGRADFLSEEISKGNFSLLLRNVTTEDKGLYKCVVHTVQESNETKVKIDIERLVVTGADLPIFAYAGQDVILNCSVDTHVPLKELEVEWIKTNGEILVLLFAEGENRPESQHERFRGRAEFFSEEIPKGNFSLKLRDVKTEDKGEFMCKVHTDRESVNAPAWLQGLGFSSLHVCVLVLTIAAAVFAVLSCLPALWSIIKKDESNRALLLYCLQVSVPCILISIAFAIWGKIESSFVEANVCSTINLMRILVIFKVAPYIKLLPGIHYQRFTDLALPLVYIVVTAWINSGKCTYCKNTFGGLATYSSANKTVY
ncbi:butyrophilin-like protein 2 isoform X1 [Anguilla rostrata]|uniref:butyrophilin-like protein 2 isoform X1 n=1 Tax=Anguilla rostrata TaxID=7938 RepID=UPI0030D46B17